MLKAANQWVTQPIVDAWKGLIQRAKEAKREFNDRGAQVEQFYSGVAGFMFRQNYMSKYLSGGNSAIKPPKFQITFNKAFEFVALMWPMLFWDMAYRKVKPYESMEVDPQVLADGDPMMLQLISNLMDQQAHTDAKAVMRAKVQERILNLLPRIQSGGGLVEDASMAVFEALLKGAGFLATEPYRYPGSEKNLVGSFHVPCDDVFVDANCRKQNWSDAGFIAIRHFHRPDLVEQMFHMEPGSMTPYASKSSSGSADTSDQGANGPGPRTDERTPRDVVEWYEIYSIAGTGNKLSGKPTINLQLDEIAGDYVYLAICPQCPWPLNFSALDMELDTADEEWARESLRWPTEYWRHNKWPINKLQFYPHSGNSSWSEPPLSPAIGELTAANILISCYVDGAYANKQQLLGVFKDRCKNLQEILNSSSNPAIIELNDSLDKTVGDILQFVNRPNVNTDIQAIISFLFSLIEERTGLAPVLYGEGGRGANARSASEYNGRRETVNIRPDFMRKRVAEWMSAVAATELFAVYSHMGTEDVADDLGPVWALVWEMLVQNEDPDVVLRSSECFVEASDIGRPNRERDADQLQQLTQYLLPILAQHLAQTGDPAPMNGFVKAIGVASNIDVSGFLIPEPQSPDEQAQMAQQYQQQLEMQKLQAEISKLTAEAGKITVEARQSGSKTETDRMVAQSKLIATQQAGQGKSEENMFRLTALKQGADIKAQAAAQAAALKQQAAEHTAMLREHTAGIQAGVAEHKTGLMEQAEDAKAHTAMIQSLGQQQAAQLASANQVNQSAMQTDKHHQTMAERQKEFQQKMLLDLIQKRQQMKQAEESHQQQSWILDDKAKQDAQHSNMIADQKLLMAATSHAAQNRGPDGK